MGTIRNWFGGKKSAPEDGVEGAVEATPPQGTPQAGAPPPAVEAAPAAAPPAIDFVAILTAAGVEADVRQRVIKAKQLLRSMPQDGPSGTKRQVVEAAFQAFEIPTQKIIDGASAEIQALRAFIRAGEDDKTTKLAAGERRIAELEAQIKDVRTSMSQVVAAQERRQRLTVEEIATVEPILKFFGRDSPPLKVAAPDAKTAAPEIEAVEVPDPFAEPADGDDSGASGSRAKPVEAPKAGGSKRSA